MLVCETVTRVAVPNYWQLYKLQPIGVGISNKNNTRTSLIYTYRCLVLVLIQVQVFDLNQLGILFPLCLTS